jgi:fibronectin type 3 domain-containing protein
VPTGLTVTSVGNATVNLSWTTSPGANFYTVQRATSTGPYLTPEPYTTLSNTVTGTTFTDPTPTNGTPYYYTVTATNAVGASANSTAISATPVPSAPSFPPANLTVTPATGEILLSWSAAPNALGYLISRATSLNGTYILIASIIATSYADTGLTNSSTYYYEITAINAGGLSAGSTPVHTTTLTPGAPNAPGNLTAAAGPAISQITLNWDAVSGATSYTLSRSTDDNNFSPIATGLTATTYTDTGLSTGVTYYYVVQALNASGPSPYSASASSVPLAPIPPAPGNLTAIAGDGQVLLQWSPALGADTYNLSRTNSNSGGSGQSTITGLTGNTYLDTSVTNGVTYTYTVNATDASGTGPASAPASATPVQTFSQWIAAYFPGVTDPNIIGPNADPDGDGLTNLEEYFLGTDPAVPDAPGTLLTTATDNSGNLVITFRASKNLTGVTYKIQESTDMLNWTDTGVTPTVQSDQGAYDIMQASAPLGSNPRLFLKLSVSGP